MVFIYLVRCHEIRNNMPDSVSNNLIRILEYFSASNLPKLCTRVFLWREKNLLFRSLETAQTSSFLSEFHSSFPVMSLVRSPCFTIGEIEKKRKGPQDPNGETSKGGQWAIRVVAFIKFLATTGKHNAACN